MQCFFDLNLLDFSDKAWFSSYSYDLLTLMALLNDVDVFDDNLTCSESLYLVSHIKFHQC